MKVINISALNIGDIILVSSKRLNSKAIRIATMSRISHAMICVGAQSIIESNLDGVHSSNPMRHIFNDADNVYLLRLKRDLTKFEIDKIIKHARSMVGASYSKKEAISTVNIKKANLSRKQFCSRLVAQSYKAAGIQLVKNTDFCTPQHLLESSLLYKVSSPTIPLSQEELLIRINPNNLINKMKAATNRLLSLARDLDPQIETINDISDYLIKNPDKDLIIKNIYLTSGYFEIGLEYREATAWQFDLELMDEIPDRAYLEQYCQNVAEDFEINVARFIENFEGYKLLIRNFPFKTFVMLMEFERFMIEFHNDRFITAQEWLATRNKVN